MKVEILIKSGLTEPLAQIQTSEMTPRIEAVKEMLEYEKVTSKINVYHGKELLIIEKQNIHLVRAELKNIIVYMRDGQWYEVKETLQDFEALLGVQFVRISKSALVNIDCIQSVKASLNGTMDVFLENGLEEVISRNYRKQFKEKLGVK